MSFVFDDSTVRFPFERRLEPDVAPDSSKRKVCKYWVFGRCQVGEECTNLHVWDASKMELCRFYDEHGACSNEECQFVHITKRDFDKECPWYNRGFCKHGPRCRFKHIRRIACPDYLAGFCPKGAKCEYAHPNFDVNQIMREVAEETRAERQKVAQEMDLPYHRRGGHGQSGGPSGPGGFGGRGGRGDY